MGKGMNNPVYAITMSMALGLSVGLTIKHFLDTDRIYPAGYGRRSISEFSQPRTTQKLGL